MTNIGIKKNQNVCEYVQYLMVTMDFQNKIQQNVPSVTQTLINCGFNNKCINRAFQAYEVSDNFIHIMY